MNWTPLHFVANKKDSSNDIERILLTKGADINIKDFIYQIIILL